MQRSCHTGAHCDVEAVTLYSAALRATRLTVYSLFCGCTQGKQCDDITMTTLFFSFSFSGRLQSVFKGAHHQLTMRRQCAQVGPSSLTSHYQLLIGYYLHYLQYNASNVCS